MPTSYQRENRLAACPQADAPALARAAVGYAQVPETGQELHLSADEATRAAVARSAGVSAGWTRLEADLSCDATVGAGCASPATVSARGRPDLRRDA